MAKLIIMRGIPGSGKSTEAKAWVAEDPEMRARVNRDNLRQMVHDGQWIKGTKESKGTEATIIAAQLAMVERFLHAGIDVVDDNTNLPARSVRQLVEIAVKVGAEWEIRDMTDVPLETCLKRDAERESGVGEDVIRGLYRRFVEGSKYPLSFEMPQALVMDIKPYEPPTDKPRAKIVDIDGTVALNNGVRGFHEYDKVDLDSPNWPVIRLVKELQAAGSEILFTSGRKDYCRDKTEAWIKEYIFPSGHFQLFMRPTFRPDGSQDNRKDYVVKLELFNEHIRDHYNVDGAIDDRLQVCRMWHQLGVPLFRVGDPDADF